jgi:hypothetical protein
MAGTGKRTGLMWWIDRWRKSTAFTDLTLEEQGAYRNLLDEGALRGGAIPDDERVLAKASGDALRWSEVKARRSPAAVGAEPHRPGGGGTRGRGGALAHA